MEGRGKNLSNKRSPTSQEMLRSSGCCIEVRREIKIKLEIEIKRIKKRIRKIWSNLASVVSHLDQHKLTDAALVHKVDSKRRQLF